MVSHVVWKPQSPNIGMKWALVTSEWCQSVWASASLSEIGLCVDSGVEDGQLDSDVWEPTNQTILRSILRKVFKMAEVKMLASVWQITIN